MNYSKLLDAITKEMDAGPIQKSLLKICESLNQNVKSFDWVGFYIMNHESNTLHLACYVGEETEHNIIPFGKGICGQVADSGQTFLVEDISKEGNYIACSINVKSEIVIPIYENKKLLAQLDIDSHTIRAFGKEEQEFLESLCLEIGNKFGPELHFNKMQF